MRIRSLQTYLVPPRWLFLRIDTDEGISGWGEPIVEGRAETVAALVSELADVLVGKDPRRIEDHWQVLTRAGFYRGGPLLSSAVAGIDQALWDITAKALGAPVHALLGGAVRDQVRIYSWVGGDEPGAVAEGARAQVENGLTAVKMNACAQLGFIDSPRQVRAIVERAESVREAVGEDVGIAIDFHGRVSTPMARQLLPLLEPVAPMFVEEPVLPEHNGHISALAAATSVPLATGERLYSRREFWPLMTSGLAVIQPDVSHAGGISEIRRIAAMAETFGVALAPHCPLGPIALAASLHVAATTPNFLIQEQSLGLHYNDGTEFLDYLVDPEAFRFDDGFVAIPTDPGLGIRIDEQAVEAAAADGHRWRPPVWRHRDGALAEW